MKNTMKNKNQNWELSEYSLFEKWCFIYVNLANGYVHSMCEQRNEENNEMIELKKKKYRSVNEKVKTMKLTYGLCAG